MIDAVPDTRIHQGRFCGPYEHDSLAAWYACPANRDSFVSMGQTLDTTYSPFVDACHIKDAKERPIKAYTAGDAFAAPSAVPARRGRRAWREGRRGAAVVRLVGAALCLPASLVLCPVTCCLFGSDPVNPRERTAAGVREDMLARPVQGVAQRLAAWQSASMAAGLMNGDLSYATVWADAGGLEEKLSALETEVRRDPVPRIRTSSVFFNEAQQARRELGRFREFLAATHAQHETYVKHVGGPEVPPLEPAGAPSSGAGVALRDIPSEPELKDDTCVPENDTVQVAQPFERVARRPGAGVVYVHTGNGGSRMFTAVDAAWVLEGASPLGRHVSPVFSRHGLDMQLQVAPYARDGEEGLDITLHLVGVSKMTTLPNAYYRNAHDRLEACHELVFTGSCNMRPARAAGRLARPLKHDELDLAVPRAVLRMASQSSGDTTLPYAERVCRAGGLHIHLKGAISGIGVETAGA